MRRAARSVALVLMLVVVTPIAVVAGLIHRRGRAVRSLWVSHPIPTVPAKAKAERSLGAIVETWAFETGRLEHRFDRVLQDSRRRPIVGVLTPFLAFVRACASFDRLHFFCDRGLLPLFRTRMFNPWELTVYRLLRKEVFFWAYGADVRTRESTLALGEPNACSQCPSPGRFCICDDKGGRANQQRIAAAAAAVFSMGDMKRHTPGSINDLFYWPIDFDDARYEPAYPSPERGGTLRVAHAPNHRHFKGTDHLIEAVETLRGRGIEIELDLIEHLTNDEALARYRLADVIFDQCLIGFHGYFALEAMALGKPVLCFIRDRGDLLAPDECPIITIRPETIAETLESLAGDRTRLEALGREGRGYAERYYSVSAFAERYQAALARLGATGS